MSVIIPINEKYRIRLDTYSWMICYWKPRSKHSKGGTWEGFSWHRTLQQAGETLVKRLASESEPEGIDEVINALSSSTLLIANAIIESGIPDSWLEIIEPEVVVIGEAPSRNLDYYTGYNTLTQNKCGDITMDCSGGQVDFYVSKSDYGKRNWLSNEYKAAFPNYIGTLNL